MFCEIFKTFEPLELILQQIVALLSKPKNPIFKPQFLKRPYVFRKTSPHFLTSMDTSIGTMAQAWQGGIGKYPPNPERLAIPS